MGREAGFSAAAAKCAASGRNDDFLGGWRKQATATVKLVGEEATFPP